MEQIGQKLYDAHQKLYKRYGRTAKPAEEATNAPLAPVSIVEWVIFLRTKRNKRRLGKIWQYYKPKLHVIRIRKVCESMRFDSGPEVFCACRPKLRVNEYVLNENDCMYVFRWCVWFQDVLVVLPSSLPVC